jgi:phage terminase large subunit-like protein
VAAYARGVAAGRVVAGRLVRLACERHFRDLAEGPARGLRWDASAACLAIDFFASVLRLNGGEHEGKPFVLEPWQAFIVGSLFGWKGPDGYRRFRSGYVEIGKGNGKSPLAAGVGLKSLLADNEPRAEVYAAATKRDQALILFRDAVAMVDQSPSLRKLLEKTGPRGREWNLAHHDSGSFFRPIASDENSQSGPRPHCALIDEVHEHRTPAVIDMMHAGLKGRRQALVLEITNSGSDRASVCWQHHHYSAQVLDGLAADDSWFAYVCGLDPCERHQKEGQIQPVEGCPDCDDWQDERVWPKANPGIDVILPRKYLREQVTKAKGMPAFEGEVRRLNFCQWTQVASRAIPADRWQSCARTVDPAGLVGRECCAALDIGATSDFTAFVLLFGHGDEELVEVPADPAEPNGPTRSLIRRSYTVLPYFWLPESPRRRDEHTAALIESWRKNGHVRTTPGDLVDYGQVFADIVDLGRSYPFRKLAIDRGFQGNWIAGKLLDQFGKDRVCEFSQGIISMNAPFREFLELVKAGRLHHPNHPVLNWMAGNVAAETRGGLIKPSKDHSPEKIDGVVAAVMALGLAVVLAGPSVYESRGILTLDDEPQPTPPPEPAAEPAAPVTPAPASPWGGLWDDDPDPDD